MADPLVTQIDNAKVDLSSIEDFVNGGPTETFTSRLGQQFKPLSSLTDEVLSDRVQIIESVSSYNGAALTVNFDGSLWQSDGTTGHTSNEANVGTLQVDALGRLFERQFDGDVNAHWFGFTPLLGSPASDDAFDLFLDYLDNEAAPGLDRRGFIPSGSYNLYRSHARPKNTGIYGAGQFNTVITFRGTKGPCFYGKGSAFDETNEKPFYIFDSDYTLTTDYGPTIKSISNVVDNGSGLCRITATAHGFTTGDIVWVAGVVGPEGANGLRKATVIDADTFDVDGAFATAYVSDGQCYKTRGNHEIANIADNGSSECRITTVNAHGLETGDWVVLGADVVVTPDFANGVYQITVIDATNFDLIQSYHDGVTAFGGGTHYVHSGTVAFLQASTQQWTKQNLTIGSGTRTFDLSNMLKCGRRHPDTGAISSGIWRGDTTLDYEENIIYGGGGLYGMVWMGNGDAPGGSNREGFANMHTIVGGYFTNAFGRGVTMRRGVVNNLISCKLSASGGDGAVIYADFNDFTGVTVAENTKGVGIWFKAGSEGNTVYGYESGGSNRLGNIRDDGWKNGFSIKNGLASERGIRYPEDADGPGVEGGLKRAVNDGLIYTTKEGEAVSLSPPTTFSRSATVAAASTANVIGFEVPLGYEFIVTRASIANLTGGFATGMEIELFQVGVGVVYQRTVADMTIAGIETPLYRSSGAAGQKFYIQLVNNSGGSLDLSGFMDVVFVET